LIAPVILGLSLLSAGLVALLAYLDLSIGAVFRSEGSLTAPILSITTANTVNPPAYTASSPDAQPELIRSAKALLAHPPLAQYGLPRLITVPGSLDAAVQAFEDDERRRPSTRRTDPGVSLDDAIAAVQSEHTANVAGSDVFASPFGKPK
jgi:hypothetical protein